MSDISGFTGGGFVPLQRIEDLGNGADATPIGGNDGGPLFPDPVVAGQDDVVRLPTGEIVPIADLGPDNVSEAIGLIDQQGIRRTGFDSSFSSSSLVRQNQPNTPVGTGDPRLAVPGEEPQTAPPGQALALRRALQERSDEINRVADQERVNNQQLDTRFGISHPERSGRSLAGRYYGEGTSVLETRSITNNLNDVATDYFGGVRRQANQFGRDRERLYRTAIADIEAFAEAAGAVDLSREELDALKLTYEDRIEQIRSVRQIENAEVDILQNRLERGDHSVLPDYLQPTGPELEVLREERDTREFTETSFQRIQQLATSNGYADRVAVESIRGMLNGTYDGAAVQDFIAWQMNVDDVERLQGELTAEQQAEIEAENARRRDNPGLVPDGTPIFVSVLSQAEQVAVLDEVADVLGLDTDLLAPTGEFGLNPAFLPREQLEFLDQQLFGFDTRRSNGSLIERESDQRAFAENIGDPETAFFANREDNLSGINFDQFVDPDAE